VTTTKRRAVVCDEHGQTNPCGNCAGDHKAGDHAPGARRDTCRRCRAPRPKPTRMADWPALAANDYTEEIPDDDD
jgi:hypothetical protein